MTPHHRPRLPIGLRRERARRGSVYMLVVFVSMLLTVIGVGAVLASRAHTKRATLQRDMADATLLAQSAVELGTSVVSDSSLWRTLVSNDTFSPSIPFGRGSMRWKATDEDGSLLDDFQDPVWVSGRGTVGSATCTMRVRCTFGRAEPYAALAVPVYATGRLDIDSGAAISVANGPLGAAELNNGGVVTGDVEAGSISGGGTVTGTTTTGAAARTFPPSTAFDDWVNEATKIPWTTVAANGNTLAAPVLSAGAAPWSATNGEGIYFIDVPNRATLTVRISRISGTLIVNLGRQSSLVFDRPMTWASHKGTEPILLVRGDDARVAIGCSAAAVIRESDVGNLNPPGSPYSGSTDSDTADMYSPTLTGLIAIWNTSGETLLGNGLSIRGIVLVRGDCTLGNSDLGAPSATFNHAAAASPPKGFSGTGATGVVPSSWERTVSAN